jgi:hypothetical protein
VGCDLGFNVLISDTGNEDAELQCVKKMQTPSCLNFANIPVLWVYDYPFQWLCEIYSKLSQNSCIDK